MKRLLLTIGFMTRIPIPRQLEIRKGDMEKGFITFPIVGLIIGSFAAAVYSLVSAVLPESIAVLAAILANLCITGAFHLDGLADTADGIYSARTPEKMLAIMKDSRLGTNGAIALFFDLAFKFAGLYHCDIKWVPILLMPVAGKMVQGVIVYKAVYPRKKGIGIYVGTVPAFAAGGAALLGLLPFIYFYGVYGLIGWVILLVFAWLFRIYVTGKIGGITGDVMGAGSELSEVLYLFLLLVKIRLL